MTFLFLIGFCTIVILALVGCLKLQTWNSSAHLLNAEGLDSSEKFKLLARPLGSPILENRVTAGMDTTSGDLGQT